MRHMKKNDGYVMAYVMIIFLVLSAVAVSISSMALKNLQAQEATVRRMEARYEAEGLLQQYVAGVKLLSAGTGLSALDAVRSQVDGHFQQDPSPSRDVSAYVLRWNEKPEGSDESDEPDVSDKARAGHNNVYVTVTAKYQHENGVKSTVVATLRIPIYIEEVESEDPLTGDTSYTYNYRLNGALEYVSYDISYEEVAG